MTKVDIQTEKNIKAALANVIDPEIGKDIVSLNMVRNINISGGNVSFSLVLTSPACPLRKELTDSAMAAVKALPGVTNINIDVKSDVPRSARLPDKKEIAGVRNTIAIASGKGGVGKSTVAVNMAAALSKAGARVGLLDIDIYGPSIPMMMGINKELQTTKDNQLIPIQSNGLKLISVGFMLDDETPLIWRGPMVMQLVKQFLLSVLWGELDYLVIDLPPGTGDAQLTLVQTIPLTGAVIVTTPQDIALIDARRAIKMFHEVNIPVLGIVENMSFFKCPNCGEKTSIFSHGGGKATSERYEVELLGSIPLDSSIREGGDKGSPVVSSSSSSSHSDTFVSIAGKVAAKISVLSLSKKQH